MPDQVLREWQRRTAVALEAHYNAARFYNKCHYWLGLPAVVFSTIVGTTVFASLESSVGDERKYFIASISIGAAILTALQTFLRYSDQAESHRMSAARFGAVNREIEMLLGFGEGSVLDHDRIDSIRVRLDTLTTEAPHLPNRYRLAAQKQHPRKKYGLPSEDPS